MQTVPTMSNKSRFLLKPKELTKKLKPVLAIIGNSITRYSVTHGSSRVEPVLVKETKAMIHGSEVSIAQLALDIWLVDHRLCRAIGRTKAEAIKNWRDAKRG